MFGDPDELQRRMAEFAEQLQGQQRLAWADNAIKLAVDLTVAAMNRINIQGTTEQLAAQRAEIEEAVRAGGPQAGVEAWLGGRVEGDALERAKAAHRAFFADYAGLASWPVSRRELRALDVPAVVLTGPWSPPHVVAAAEALAELLPAARRATDGDLAAAAQHLIDRD